MIFNPVEVAADLRGADSVLEHCYVFRVRRFKVMTSLNVMAEQSHTNVCTRYICNNI